MEEGSESSQTESEALKLELHFSGGEQEGETVSMTILNRISEIKVKNMLEKSSHKNTFIPISDSRCSESTKHYAEQIVYISGGWFFSLVFLFLKVSLPRGPTTP